ncbi:rho GTPase-activating protein 15-like [Leucoraja erinacea]|uniref:rho GTPase-activating protein 15-like n=1 Tax=Leucoraja erinaceus TaxID=7782 RepID=UPI002457CBEA|nr:rho GTPase-activating protein 15-like [Leucoraja erinacea]
MTDAEERLERAKELVEKLPQSNHDTICVLFRHFQRVVEHTHVNRMTVQSLSIVFGPTLLRTEGDPLAMPYLTVYQSQVVEMVLNDCDLLFTE